MRNNTRGRQWVSQYDFIDASYGNDTTTSFQSNQGGEINNNAMSLQETASSSLIRRTAFKVKPKKAVLFSLVLTFVTLNYVQFKPAAQPFIMDSSSQSALAGDENSFFQVLSNGKDALLGSDSTSVARESSLRHRGLASCGKKTPYVTRDQALNSMPPLNGGSEQSYEPTHITLCKELIARNNQAEKASKAAKTGDEDSKNVPIRFERLRVQEGKGICSNWDKPHSGLVQLISSSVVAFVGSRFGLEYDHDCRLSIPSSGYVHDFDVTTIQQIFPQLRMPLNTEKVGFGEVVHELCSACINGKEPNNKLPDHMEDPHHCLLFPDLGDVHLDFVREKRSQNVDGSSEGVVEEALDSNNHIVHTVLEAVLPLVRNRLYHSSLDWASRANIPGHDPTSGAVIYIDPHQSLPIPFYLYQQNLPQKLTHVSILSGPACASTKMGNGDLTCFDYGNELQQYLQNHYSQVDVNVSFDLVASTAAAYSRMILSHLLICPPGSITCLFPAMAKEKTKIAIIFESPDSSSTFHWFNYMGKSVSQIKVVTLSADQMQRDSEQIQLDSELLSQKQQQQFTQQVEGGETTDNGMNKVDEKVYNEDEGFYSVEQQGNQNSNSAPISTEDKESKMTEEGAGANGEEGDKNFVSSHGDEVDFSVSSSNPNSPQMQIIDEGSIPTVKDGEEINVIPIPPPAKQEVEIGSGQEGAGEGEELNFIPIEEEVGETRTSEEAEVVQKDFVSARDNNIGGVAKESDADERFKVIESDHVDGQGDLKDRKDMFSMEGTGGERFKSYTKDKNDANQEDTKKPNVKAVDETSLFGNT